MQAALRKLLAALPAPLREGAERGELGRSSSTPATWGRARRRNPSTSAPLRQAVLDARQVVLGYTGRAGSAVVARRSRRWGS